LEFGGRRNSLTFLDLRLLDLYLSLQTTCFDLYSIRRKESQKLIQMERQFVLFQIPLKEFWQINFPLSQDATTINSDSRKYFTLVLVRFVSTKISTLLLSATSFGLIFALLNLGSYPI